MSLVKKIEQDFLIAFKARKTDEVDLLRLLKTALKNKAIELGKEVDDATAMQLIKTEIKKRKDALEVYRSGGREELAVKEEAEIKILQEYLPEELSDEKIRDMVSVVISELPEEQKENFGAVMSSVMKKVGGQADGQTVNKLVREILNK